MVRARRSGVLSRCEEAMVWRAVLLFFCFGEDALRDDLSVLYCDFSISLGVRGRSFGEGLEIWLNRGEGRS